MRAPVWLLALLGAAHSTSALRQPRINAAHKTSVRAAPGGDDAASLFAEAARLRREAAEAEREITKSGVEAAVFVQCLNRCALFLFPFFYNVTVTMK